MSGKTRILAVVLLCLFSVSAFAIDLSLDDAVSLAQKNSLEINSASLDLKNLRDAAGNEWTVLLPELSATGTVFSPTENEYMKTFSFNGVLSATLYFNPGLFTQISVARKSYETGKISYEMALDTVSCETKKLYYSILLNRELTESLKSFSDLRKNDFEVAQIRYNEGVISKAEYLQTKVAYNVSLRDLKKSIQNEKDCSMQLAILLGLDAEEKLNLSDSIPNNISLPSMLDNAVDSAYYGYEVVDAQNRAELNSLAKKALDLKAFVPTLSVGQTWAPNISDLSEKAEGDNFSNSGTFIANVTWSVSDMFPSSENRRNAQKAATERDKAILEKENLIREKKSKISQSVSEVRNCYDFVGFSAESLEAAQSSYDVVKLEYEQGCVSLSDLNSAANELKNATIENLSARADYISALIDLSFLTRKDYI